MAARRLHSRILHFFGSQRCQPSSILREHSCLSSSNIPPFNIHEYLRRRIQTQQEPTANLKTKETPNNEGSSTKTNTLTGQAFPEEQDQNSYSAVKCSATSSLKVSSRHDLAMIYTCKVCETRSMKTVCRESYDKGVVVVRCGGCNNLHLIADHLGWFGQPGSIEELLAARGEEVKKGSVDTLNLTLEDLAGKKL